MMWLWYFVPGLLLAALTPYALKSNLGVDVYQHYRIAWCIAAFIITLTWPYWVVSALVDALTPRK